MSGIFICIHCEDECHCEEKKCPHCSCDECNCREEDDEYCLRIGLSFA
jgi:hypothetical protein